MIHITATKVKYSFTDYYPCIKDDNLNYYLITDEKISLYLKINLIDYIQLLKQYGAYKKRNKCYFFSSREETEIFIEEVLEPKLIMAMMVKDENN